MLTSRDEKYILSDKDLPAQIFDDKCNDRLNIGILSNVYNSEELENPIEIWIVKFKDQFEQYFKKELKRSEENAIREKRCRDFNYWVFHVINQIQEIVKDSGKVKDNTDGIKAFTEGLFRTNNEFGCSLDIDGNREQRDIKKKLDNFCENRDSFKKKLSSYNHTECEKYKNYVNMTISSFNKFILKGYTKKNDYLYINEKCNFNKRCAIFPIIQCYSNEMVVTEYVETSENEPCKNIDEYLEAIWNYDTIKSILSASSPVAGIIVISLALYKFSPIKSWISKEKSKFNILPDGFEEPEISDLLDLPDFVNDIPGNDMYKIGYHTT
ncbi:PIR Superfamily Protein [Plasmodium ovale wallikeri]|uniref:PIR Superfamily Protein n=1 Tax=Plasmodium ovale wallikeri TaxID=864142 RepID=A0A1A9AL18_PLAOA|nr:PIR Superfamily Protein [Plasmodium ovale wallikeri]SBT56921.1 PIR Superfamily Protein [Plasmodium ovale wallikeri]